ncbi:MAG: hypothetical protein CVV41_01655 [Candidatus Riflebacteria bacterium HGW-Riflebacteria-1]|nr:MAG: hypothetical protein CVV41_01655 [Candidatus Riflebacteria bacterium HGW-Riflebacteria-1]
MCLVASKAMAYDASGYEIYSMADYTPPAVTVARTVLKPSPRNAINSDGMGGFFVGNTADLFDPEQLILSSRYKYHKLTSTRGIGLHSSEDGSVSTFESSLTWVGKWAEWAVTVPLHDWDLSAPRTFGGYAQSNTGMGNMRLGWKATYLPDKSYYRFAYGAVMGITTGNPARMLPAGSKNSDELKLFGCVTTSETDRATANLELGAVIDSESDDDRFLYRLGMSYEATKHVSLIGEVTGEVLGGDDKDTMDLVMGIRVQPTTTWTLEFVYYKNLRTYRDYGWDDQLQAGYTLRW